MSIFLWVFLGVLLVCCVIPMLLMAKRNKNRPGDTRDDKGGDGSMEL